MFRRTNLCLCIYPTNRLSSFGNFLVQPIGALIWAYIAVFPIWFAGANVKRFLVYVVFFSLILLAPALTEKFRKIRHLSELPAILFFSGLLILERSLFLSLATPVLLVLFLLLVIVIYGRPSFRQIIAINFVIFLSLLIATEIGFRFATENYKGLS